MNKLADVKWIKIVTDIFDDEKILLMESMPSADSIIVIWFKLLCMAGKMNNSGVFTMGDKIAYTDEMLATIFRRDLNTVRLALKTFEEFGMIEIVNNTITIPNWSKHQNLDQLEAKKEYMKGYMREYREKQRLLADGKSNSKANVSEADKNRSRIEKNNTLCAEVVAYLNEKTGKNFRASTAETQRHINARIEDGYTLDDFKKVIDVKCKEWLNTGMEKFLRPKTLFIPSNFDSYLNDYAQKTYDEESNCFKLAKCFENFLQKLDSKFEYENINLVCASFEQLTISGRTPKEIYAVMATMFKSNNKYMIKKYSDYQLFCKDFEKIGRDLIIDNKGGV